MAFRSLGPHSNTRQARLLVGIQQSVTGPRQIDALAGAYVSLNLWMLWDAQGENGEIDGYCWC